MRLDPSNEVGCRLQNRQQRYCNHRKPSRTDKECDCKKDQTVFPVAGEGYDSSAQTDEAADPSEQSGRNADAQGAQTDGQINEECNGIGNSSDNQEWLGHSDISTTSNIYTHLDFSSKISSANAILPTFPKNVQHLSSE